MRAQRGDRGCSTIEVVIVCDGRSGGHGGIGGIAIVIISDISGDMQHAGDQVIYSKRII